MTYGWTILLIAIAMSILFTLGVFNGSSYAPTICSLPGQFSCSAVLAYNGNLLITLRQSAQPLVSITAIGCNTNSILSNNIMQHVLPPVNIILGGNSTIITQCFDNATVANRKIGNVYSGYIILNYTNPATSFTHTLVGTLIVKSTTQAVSTTVTTSSTTICC